MRWFSTFVLLLATLFCFFTAATSGIAPREFARRLGLETLGTSGYNEIRAQYAGFFLATGTICVAALLGLVSKRSALVVLAVLFGGLIGGRVGSLAINRGFAGYTSTILALYVIDAGGLVLALAAIAFDKTPATG
jgi:hypothetical protein